MVVTAAPLQAADHLIDGTGLVTLVNKKIEEKVVLAVSFYPF